MESPFEFFRKHQKQALVFLFLTAMLAFTVGEPLMKLFSYARGGGGTGEVSLIESNAGNLTRTDVEQLMQRRAGGVSQMKALRKTGRANRQKQVVAAVRLADISRRAIYEPRMLLASTRRRTQRPRRCRCRSRLTRLRLLTS